MLKARFLRGERLVRLLNVDVRLLSVPLGSLPICCWRFGLRLDGIALLFFSGRSRITE